MGFIESYKHLEKLCGEILNDDRRLSAYIDEMVNTPNGSVYVQGWNNDLKQLKHYRWIRNQIAHEPGCTEANMCGSNDALWLDMFHSRIMNQTDPLAQYYKVIRSQTASKAKQVYKTETQNYTYSQQANKNKKSSWEITLIIGFAIIISFVIGILIIAAVMLFVSRIL